MSTAIMSGQTQASTTRAASEIIYGSDNPNDLPFSLAADLRSTNSEAHEGHERERPDAQTAHQLPVFRRTYTSRSTLH